MKSLFFFPIFLLLTLLGCDKSNNELTSSCLEVKYIGRGCKEVIQIITPISSTYMESWSVSGDSLHNNCIAVDELATEYKNGGPFYIQPTTVYLIPMQTADCTVPKHAITYTICDATQPQ